MDHGSCTHGAGFERDIQRAICQAVIAERLAGLTHGNDLRVGRGVVIANHAVLSAAEHRGIGADDHRADGHFSGGLRQLRLSDCEPQPDFVGRLCRLEFHC
jgi:hypothetical protein